MDSLIHLVRFFEDSGITHVHGEPDPLRDIEVINTELLLSDLEIADKRLQKIKKTAQTTGDKSLKKEIEILEKVLSLLSENKNLRGQEWSKEELVLLKVYNFISLKPVLYVCNFKEEDFAGQKADLSSIKQSLGSKEDAIPISCALEADMIGWTNKERNEFLQPLGLKEPVFTYCD